MTSPKSPTQPIPISSHSSSSNRNKNTTTSAPGQSSRRSASPRGHFTRDPFNPNKSLSPFSTLDSSIDPSPTSSSAIPFGPEPVECPPQFLPRPRGDSQIQLDVFHHPAELYTPTSERIDPMDQTTSPSQIRTAKSPRIVTGSPPLSSGVFDAARSPVLAIHHTRGPSALPEEDDMGITRTMSGISLNNTGESPRRTGSIASETTYVPMTPLPNNCILSFLDRPREMAQLMNKNPELFRLIEHAVPREKYHELLMLWKTPRELVPDEEWVHRTRSYIAMGPDEDEGGALWTRWRELVGWDPEETSEEEEDDDNWNYQPKDTTLQRRWSELERIRQEEAGQAGSHGGPVSYGASYGSGIGLSGIGLQEITEDEAEEEFENGERPAALHGRHKKG